MKTVLRSSAPLSFIEPLIPTLVEAPPTGEGWLHEIKRNGHRTILILENGKTRAFTRRGHDWTTQYAPIVREAAAKRCSPRPCLRGSGPGWTALVVQTPGRIVLVRSTS
jgi:ATP-dependent DNA ligase